MNRIRIIRRLTCLVVGLTVAALSSAVAIPAALAVQVPPAGGARGANPPPPVPAHVIVNGGMPGWQIALIGAGAAVLAAALTALISRARTGRRPLAHAGA